MRYANLRLKLIYYCNYDKENIYLFILKNYLLKINKYFLIRVVIKIIFFLIQNLN
jgi:hypothetical protein